MAVAIVNHNTCEHLRACLAAVEQEAPAEVVVVDNASSDGSVDMIQAEFPWVVLVANEENPGYGAAANQAISSCQSRYVLLLNSDTRSQPGTLQALSAYLDQHPRAAIVGPRLVNPDGSLQPSCYAFPTPLHVFLEESSLGRLAGAIPILNNLSLRTWPHTHSRAVPWVLGAALAIRRQAFVAEGGFDESFFMYAEEIDLCYRLGAAGWQTHFTPAATIVHSGGASTRQQRTAMAVQYFTSLRHFYRRRYSRARQAQLVLIIKSIVMARLIRETARFHLTSSGTQRAGIAEDMAAWRQILYPSKAGDVAKG